MSMFSVSKVREIGPVEDLRETRLQKPQSVTYPVSQDVVAFIAAATRPTDEEIKAEAKKMWAENPTPFTRNMFRIVDEARVAKGLPPVSPDFGPGGAQ